MVGCPYEDEAAGRPKAHFSFSCPTAAGDKPADLADWKRRFAISGLQPFHAGADVTSWMGGLPGQGFAIIFASPLPVAPSLRPPTHSAMSRFCWSVRLAACVRMAPVVRTS